MVQVRYKLLNQKRQDIIGVLSFFDLRRMRWDLRAGTVNSGIMAFLLLKWGCFAPLRQFYSTKAGLTGWFSFLQAFFVF